MFSFFYYFGEFGWNLLNLFKLPVEKICVQFKLVLSFELAEPFELYKKLFLKLLNSLDDLSGHERSLLFN